MDAIFSIKPVYAEAIISGQKTFEYRSRVPRQKLDKCYIYATYPTQRIIGYFTVKEIMVDDPLEIWNATYRSGGIKAKDFIDYYKDKKSAVAIEIDQVVVFEKAIQYKEIDSVGKPPMSFKYIQ